MRETKRQQDESTEGIMESDGPDSSQFLAGRRVATAAVTVAVERRGKKDERERDREREGSSTFRE